MSFYKGSLIKALKHLFPEIRFEECKFTDLPGTFFLLLFFHSFILSFFNLFLFLLMAF